MQTLTRFGAPLTVARTRWMFGLKRRFVILRDHGRLLPKPGFLAQMSQTAATVHSLGLLATKSGDPVVEENSDPGNRRRINDTDPCARIEPGIGSVIHIISRVLTLRLIHEGGA